MPPSLPVSNTDTLPVSNTDTLPVSNTDTLPVSNTDTLPVSNIDSLSSHAIPTVSETELIRNKFRIEIETLHDNLKKRINFEESNKKLVEYMLNPSSFSYASELILNSQVPEVQFFGLKIIEYVIKNSWKSISNKKDFLKFLFQLYVDSYISKYNIDETKRKQYYFINKVQDILIDRHISCLKKNNLIFDYIEELIEKCYQFDSFGKKIIISQYLDAFLNYFKSIAEYSEHKDVVIKKNIDKSLSQIPPKLYKKITQLYEDSFSFYMTDIKANEKILIKVIENVSLILDYILDQCVTVESNVFEYTVKIFISKQVTHNYMIEFFNLIRSFMFCYKSNKFIIDKLQTIYKDIAYYIASNFKLEHVELHYKSFPDLMDRMLMFFEEFIKFFSNRKKMKLSKEIKDLNIWGTNFILASMNYNQRSVVFWINLFKILPKSNKDFNWEEYYPKLWNYIINKLPLRIVWFKRDDDLGYNFTISNMTLSKSSSNLCLDNDYKDIEKKSGDIEKEYYFQRITEKNIKFLMDKTCKDYKNTSEIMNQSSFTHSITDSYYNKDTDQITLFYEDLKRLTYLLYTRDKAKPPTKLEPIVDIKEIIIKEFEKLMEPFSKFEFKTNIHSLEPLKLGEPGGTIDINDEIFSKLINLTVMLSISMEYYEEKIFLNKVLKIIQSMESSPRITLKSKSIVTLGFIRIAVSYPKFFNDNSDHLKNLIVYMFNSINKKLGEIREDNYYILIAKCISKVTQNSIHNLYYTTINDLKIQEFILKEVLILVNYCFNNEFNYNVLETILSSYLDYIFYRKEPKEYLILLDNFYKSVNYLYMKNIDPNTIIKNTCISILVSHFININKKILFKISLTDVDEKCKIFEYSDLSKKKIIELCQEYIEYLMLLENTINLYEKEGILKYPNIIKLRTSIIQYFVSFIRNIDIKDYAEIRLKIYTKYYQEFYNNSLENLELQYNYDILDIIFYFWISNNNIKEDIYIRDLHILFDKICFIMENNEEGHNFLILKFFSKLELIFGNKEMNKFILTLDFHKLYKCIESLIQINDQLISIGNDITIKYLNMIKILIKRELFNEVEVLTIAEKDFLFNFYEKVIGSYLKLFTDFIFERKLTLNDHFVKLVDIIRRNLELYSLLNKFYIKTLENKNDPKIKCFVETKMKEAEEFKIYFTMKLSANTQNISQENIKKITNNIFKNVDNFISFRNYFKEIKNNF